MIPQPLLSPHADLFFTLRSMRQVPISNMLNDMRNLAVRRVAAGLEPHMSGAARTRDETSGQWEDAWLILSRVSQYMNYKCIICV